jgi:TolA-binding protein
VKLVLTALLLLSITPSSPAQICPDASEYGRALCLFIEGDFVAAESAFATIAAGEEPSPTLIRAMYFLARSKMALKKFDEAEAHLIRIYASDSGFYQEWGCDFLLGESRKAQGKG